MYPMARDDAFTKIKFFIERFCFDLSKESTRDVIITDKYFFKESNMNPSDYAKKLIRLFEDVKIDTLTVFTRCKPYCFNREVFNEFKDSVNFEVRIINFMNIHDRFWIFDFNDDINISGFLIGGSINTIGESFCILKELTKEELFVIKEYIILNIKSKYFIRY